MSSLEKYFIAVSAVLLMTAFAPVQKSQAAIFEGFSEGDTAFGICIGNPEIPECANIDCDSPEDSVKAECISEAEAGTGLAKDSLAGTGITHTDNFGDYVIKLVNFALPYLTLAAFIGYVVAGFLYVTAFGNDEQLQKAKKILIWATVGIILVILSYAITSLLTGSLVERLNPTSSPVTIPQPAIPEA